MSHPHVLGGYFLGLQESSKFFLTYFPFQGQDHSGADQVVEAELHAPTFLIPTHNGKGMGVTKAPLRGLLIGLCAAYEVTLFVGRWTGLRIRRGHTHRRSQDCSNRMYNEDFCVLRVKQEMSHLREEEGEMVGLD